MVGLYVRDDRYRRLCSVGLDMLCSMARWSIYLVGFPRLELTRALAHGRLGQSIGSAQAAAGTRYLDRPGGVASPSIRFHLALSWLSYDGFRRLVYHRLDTDAKVLRFPLLSVLTHHQWSRHTLGALRFRRTPAGLQGRKLGWYLRLRSTSTNLWWSPTVG